MDFTELNTFRERLLRRGRKLDHAGTPRGEWPVDVLLAWREREAELARARYKRNGNRRISFSVTAKTGRAFKAHCERKGLACSRVLERLVLEHMERNP